MQPLSQRPLAPTLPQLLMKNPKVEGNSLWLLKKAGAIAAPGLHSVHPCGERHAPFTAVTPTGLVLPTRQPRASLLTELHCSVFGHQCWARLGDAILTKGHGLSRLPFFSAPQVGPQAGGRRRPLGQQALLLPATTTTASPTGPGSDQDHRTRTRPGHVAPRGARLLAVNKCTRPRSSCAGLFPPQRTSGGGRWVRGQSLVVGGQAVSRRPERCCQRPGRSVRWPTTSGVK